MVLATTRHNINECLVVIVGRAFAKCICKFLIASIIRSDGTQSATVAVTVDFRVSRRVNKFFSRSQELSGVAIVVRSLL